MPILLGLPAALDDFNAVQGTLDAWVQAMADWVERNAESLPGKLAGNVSVFTADGSIKCGSYNFVIAINP
jgi:hypothetical protein